ncbi:MAG TPA: DUF2800 domain-containing protein, partial [Phycisphaerae bacterium]|nr:DUF2800 domain-containing protein [Phycisphaerae bacterium]
MSDHHPFGPSKLDHLALCPRYVGDDVGEAAVRGSLIHAVAAGEKSGVFLDEEGEAMVAFWHDTVGGQGGKIELRMGLYDDDFEELLFGTADYVVVEPDAVRVFDLKTGEEYPAYYQMMAYAACAMETFARDHAWVSLVYAKHRRTVDMQFRDLPALRERIRVVIARAKDPAAPHCPGAACDWCGRKPTCPGLTAVVKAAVTGYEKADVVIPEWHPSAIFDPDEMAKALSVAKAVAKWAESVEYHAKAMAMTGAALPGFKLCERKGTASVANIVRAYELAGLPPEKFLAAASLSIPKLAKVV